MDKKLKDMLVKTAEQVMFGTTVSTKEIKRGEVDAIFMQRRSEAGEYGVSLWLSDGTVWVATHAGKTERSKVLLVNPFRPASL